MNKKVINASYWKHLLSFLVDAVLAIGLGFILYSFVTSTYLFNHLGGEVAKENIFSFCVDSHLMETKPLEDNPKDGSVSLYQYKDNANSESTDADKNFVVPSDGRKAYEVYYDLVYNYYTEFLSNAEDERIVTLKNGEVDFTKEDYLKYFNNSIFLLPKEASSLEEIDRSSAANPYFCLPLTEDGTAVNYLGKPILKSDIQAKVDASDIDTLRSLRNFFLNPEASKASEYGIYYNAVLDFTGSTNSGTGQTYYKNQASIINFANSISQIVAFIPLQFIFFFIIPVFVKGGKTIGKLIFNLPVTDLEGVALSPLKRILRPLYMAIMLSLFFMPNQMLLVLGFILFLIDSLLISFSKDGQSLHDKIFKSVVIDGKTSTWFASLSDKEEYLESHPEEREDKEEKNEEDLALDALIRQEDKVLDLATIEKRRKEAREITSFDEFEAKKEEEFKALKEKNLSKVVNLSKEDEKETK